MASQEEVVPEYVYEATAKNLAAEADFFAAQAASQRAVTKHQSLLSTSVSLDLNLKKRLAAQEMANDGWNHVYRMASGVDGAKVQSMIATLSTWDRVNPEADWTIVFNSPGGDVVPGLALFDFLTEMKTRHHITTVAQGYAASMGGILLQAGTHRVIGQESWILIHEISAGMMGSFGDLEDRMGWLTKVQDRILDIFATRSDGKKTKEEFETAWRRKDFWLSSDDALDWGIVDAIQ